MQTSLYLSLARVLHEHTALLADTGTPPLKLTRNVHCDLAKLHFRLTITKTDILPAPLFKKLNRPFPLSNLHTTTLHYHIRYATHAFKIDLQTDPLPHMASQPSKNRERAFRNMIRKIFSDLWKGQFHNAVHTPSGQPLGRKASYIHIARDDLQRLDLFKPAQFWCTPTTNFRFFDLEPKPPAASHLHLKIWNTHTYTPYAERYCSSCFPLKILGNVAHTLLHCPHSSPLAQPGIHSLMLNLWRFDLWAWATYTDTQKVAMLLGSIPPKTW